LIQAHGYPKEYFFAVTNKGVGGLLKRWGEGASLIRGEWKARKANEEGGGSGDSDGNAIEADSLGSDGEPQATAGGHESRLREATDLAKGDDAIDALLDGMGALSLVPSSVRFGRGGNKGGFSGHSERSATTGRGRGRGLKR